jgi:hypothetical protein
MRRPRVTPQPGLILMQAFIKKKLLLLVAALGIVSANAMAGQVSLAWNSVAGATGYTLHYGTASGSYSSNIDAKNVTSYTVSSLTDGMKYYFAVRAYNATTTSGYSSEINSTIPSAPAPPPSSPPPSSPPPSGGGSGGSTAVMQGLVAAYGFEELSGAQAIDASGYGNHGTISNATRVTTTQFGNVLRFTGSNSSWVTVNDSASLDLTTGMTLEAWVYPTAISGWRTVIMKEQAGMASYWLYANDDYSRPSNVVNVGGVVRQLSAGSQLPINSWSHLASTYDGNTQKLYLNGVLVGSQAQTGAIALSSGALRIGGNAVWPWEYFSGYIDEVRVYNRALTQLEISADSRMAVVGLVMSTSSNRTNSVPLSGAPVSGNIYVSYKLIGPTAAAKPAKQVKFWLDDPNPNSPTGTPRSTDSSSPFDFAGTRDDGTAIAFNTDGLSSGIHTITAQVTLNDGTVLPYVKGTFTRQ